MGGILLATLVGSRWLENRALSNMLTAGAIAPAVEQIASPVTGICPRSENLKLYVNYVPCNLLFGKVRSIGLGEQY